MACNKVTVIAVKLKLIMVLFVFKIARKFVMNCHLFLWYTSNPPIALRFSRKVDPPLCLRFYLTFHDTAVQITKKT